MMSICPFADMLRVTSAKRILTFYLNFKHEYLVFLKKILVRIALSEEKDYQCDFFNYS